MAEPTKGLKSVASRGKKAVANPAPKEYGAPERIVPEQVAPPPAPVTPPTPPEPPVQAPAPEPVPVQAPPPSPPVNTPGILAAPAQDARSAALAHLKANDPTASLMHHHERVDNPALPRRADRVNDWFPEYHYRWIMSPNRNRPDIGALAGLGLDHATQRGYRFFRAEDMRRGPNAEGLPWHPSWEDDDGKVLWAGMWLMYRSADYERHARKDLERRAKSKREAARAPTELNEQGQRSLGFESERVPVNKLLQETPDPSRGKDGVLRAPRVGGGDDSFDFGKMDGYGSDDYG